MGATAREQRMPGRAPRPAVTAGMRVALVHDWLTGMRGGEKVLDAICELFPEAPLYTLIRVPGSVSRRIENRRIVTSIAQALPRPDRFYRYYLPLYPLAIELFDLDHYDLIISSSHCAAKSVVRTGGSVHVCYCHSPMRYAWDQFDAYFGPDRIGPLGSRLLRPVLRRLARWDAATAGRVDRFLANSQYVAGRIDRYYNRRSTIVHPPVDTDFYTPVGRRAASSAFLIVSALVPYKRLDVAIDACRRVGRPLRIVGTGPELARLRARAGSGVEFLGWQSDEQIRALYRESAATLLPGVEDFGIVPVEAQACGCPAVALDAGGARDTIVDGVTGVLVPEPTAAAFAGGLVRALATPFDPEAIRANALRFSRPRFLREFRAAVEDALAASRHRQGAGPHDPPAGWSSQETGPSSPQAGREPGDTPAGRPAPSQQAGREPGETAARWSPPRQQAGREPGETAARWSPPRQQADRENKQ